MPLPVPTPTGRAGRGHEMRRVFKENRTPIPLKSLAIPAGFEPATHGVESRSEFNDINYLGATCTIGVPSRAEKPQFNTFGGALVCFVIDEQVAIGVER